MKRFLTILLLAASFAPLCAEKLEDRYVMKALDEGQLYYIAPFDIPSLEKRTKNLSVDITCLTSSDSITMNMSVWNEQELTADSIVFVGKKNFVIKNFQTFFIEKDGKLWIHRYSLRYPFNNLISLYGDNNSYTICIYDNGRKIRYAYAEKAWKKEQDWMNQILHIINTSKRLNKK